jgi:hypothetical protein
MPQMFQMPQQQQQQPIVYEQGGYKTIVIDTSPNAMGEGFQETEGAAERGQPVMGGQRRSHHTTPRGYAKRGPPTVSGSTPSPSTKITVQKLG